METLSLFTEFSALLNCRSEDAALGQLLDSVGVQRRPMKPTFFKSPFAVPFHVSKLGLLLYFEDSNWVEGRRPRTWGDGELLLRSVAVTSGVPKQAERFPGRLPAEISWEDNRERVRAKMAAQGEIGGVLHEGWRDCWWQGEQFLSVFYQPGEIGAADTHGVYEITQGLFDPPSQPAHGLLPEQYPKPQEIIDLFGQSGKSLGFRHVFSAFDPETWDWDSHMDMSLAYGFELYFDPSRPATDGTPAFVGINLKRDRLGPSTAWLGKLPLDLKWNDSINEVLRRMGRRPEKWDLSSAVWGWAKWFQSDHLLWVNFDTMCNYLESIAIMDLEYEMARAE